MNTVSYFLVVALIAAVVFWSRRRAGANSEQAKAELAKGQTFLEENEKKDGVICTDSGLQYLVLEQGDDTTFPKATDKVRVHYHGTLISGKVFDSSVDRGQSIAFGLNQVIAGWTEGLQRMSVGEKARLFIPANLAYGSRGTGGIPGNSTLIFEVELIAIEK